MITITVDDINNPNNEFNMFPLTLDERDERARDFMRIMLQAGALNDSGIQKLNEIGITWKKPRSSHYYCVLLQDAKLTNIAMHIRNAMSYTWAITIALYSHGF